MKRPILYIFIPFASGIAAAYAMKFPVIGVLCLGAVLLVLAMAVSRRNILSHIALYLAVFLIGILYYQNSTRLPGDHVSRYASDIQRKIFLKGVISDDPVTALTQFNKTKTIFVLDVAEAKEDGPWRKASGLVDVTIFADTDEKLHYGQTIVLEGVITKPIGLKNPGLFDYSKYLAIKDIYAVLRVKDGGVVEIVSDKPANPLKSVAYRVRDWMRGTLDKYLDPPYNGFIKAIMIGDRTDLKYSLNADFIKTGTIHAIAISGLNVGLIAAMFMAILALLRLPRKANLILVAFIMILYTFIAGASPPIVRAVIIYLVVVAGYLINRDSDMLNSLALAALVMLLANPKELFDPSFQLSFVSIASMIIFIPKVNGLLGIDGSKRDSLLKKVRFYLLEGIAVSISAWLGTWPIVASYFNIISPVALLANLVVVPALFLLTAASFLFLSASLISNFFTSLLAGGLSFACRILFAANHALALAPFAYFRIPRPSPEFVILYYVAVILTIIPSEIYVGKVILRRIQLVLAVLVCLNILVWSGIASAGRDTLRITFMDVGQGDSALIEFPNGKNILVDAGVGGDEELFDAGRSVVAPFLWNKGINRIDAVIATHFHEDHLGGIIYVLENFPVGIVMDNGALAGNSGIYNRYVKTIKRKNIHRVTMGEGDEISYGGAKIIVLSPPKDRELTDSNDNSIVLKLQYKNFSALLCADTQESSLERMAAQYGKLLKSDVIKIPHHGGNVGSQSVVNNFLGFVRPKIAVISVAKINKYRLPSQKMLDVIRLSKPVIYQTKDEGAIAIIAGEGTYKVETYRQNN